VIMKRRLPKKYRIPQLDSELRYQRTVHESQIIHKAKQAGVPTPSIFMIDPAEASIIMEFVDGKQVKQILNDLPSEERQGLCRHIGELIGLLHKNGIVHGDLTTSNMLLTPSGRVIFVDFGLSERLTEMEAKGVDMHLMKRAFQSTHYKYANESFDSVLEGYTRVIGENETKDLLKKIHEIEKRGRYISER